MANKKYGLINYINDDDNYNLIVKDKYNIKNIDYNEKNYNEKNKDIDDYYLSSILNYPQYISQTQIFPRNSINWGSDLRTDTQNAFIEPTQEEVQRVLSAIHMIQGLDEETQKQLIEATKEIRYFFDGRVRARFGATQHYNAIRCLNNPTVTQVADVLSVPKTQLAGEEFFALNRFMANYPDVADIQWWAVYKDGSWGLDTWNPEGEHLDTGINGWGNLVGSVIKLNGRVLSPSEIMGLYRGIKLRNERGFMDEASFGTLQSLIKMLDSGVSLPRRLEEQIETAHDLGLVDADGKTLTYIGRSMITPVTARERRQRQLDETNPEIRRIVVPTILE